MGFISKMQDEHDFFFLYISDHFFGIFDGVFKVTVAYIEKSSNIYPNFGLKNEEKIC